MSTATERPQTENTDATLSIVRAYHLSWTSKRFEEATRLLSQELKVEVPINEYPTAESFAKAVAAFGSLTKNVALLAEFANGDQAMLLYDMDVEGLGRLRVAEHFTVKQGRIVRIRQVHDTAALRGAGFGS